MSKCLSAVTVRDLERQRTELSLERVLRQERILNAREHLPLLVSPQSVPFRLLA